MVQPITQQIQDWKSTDDLSELECKKLKRLETFQNLTKLEFYLCDVVEHYTNIDAFVELLRTMGVLCYPHLSIQNMEGTFVKEDVEKGWENEWIFEFEVNGEDAEISISPPQDAGFFEKILSEFNKILQQHGFYSQFRRLNVIGDLLDKPTVEIGLFEPIVLKKMLKKK